jgi:hypothetical protein
MLIFLSKWDKHSPSKNRLAEHPQVILDKRTRSLKFEGESGIPVQIDVLNAGIARIPFEEGFPIIVDQDGAKLASPTLLLNYKISSSYSRSTEVKKLTDL